MLAAISRIFSRLNRFLARLPDDLIILAVRLLVFKIFWFSVQDKITGLSFAGQHFAFWNINNQTFLDFNFVYKIPLLPPLVAAYIGTWSEFFLAIMIFLGFMTRLAALGLLVLTLVIACYIDPNGWWDTYIYWGVCLLILMSYGGGKLSIDHLFRRR